MLTTYSAAQLLSLYKGQRASPVDVIQAVFERISALDPTVNAFAWIDEEAALAAARASEARWMRNEPLGPVDGLPMTVKDLLLTETSPTRRGSLVAAAGRSQLVCQDAPAVARLNEQGAILVGKTTTSEFGWKCVTDSPLTGITRNPWNVDKTPGGSSGGAAVAAALGFGVLHLGTDGAGSVRVPASMTGVFGFKPSFGRVPGYPPAHTGSLFHIGALTRTVTDTSLMMTVMAQPDHRDGQALPFPKIDWQSSLAQGITGLRIAYGENFGSCGVDPHVQALVSSAVEKFEQLGATVEAVCLPMDGIRDVFETLWYAAAAKLVRTLPADQLDCVDPGLIAIAAIGDRLSLHHYLAAMDAQVALTQRMKDFHQTHHLLLTPTLPITAFAVGQNVPELDRYLDWLDWTPFTYPFNLTQQPAASVPCGFTPAGLPVGLQIIGPRYKDLRVLQAAFAYESIVPFVMPNSP